MKAYSHYAAERLAYTTTIVGIDERRDSVLLPVEFHIRTFAPEEHLHMPAPSITWPDGMAEAVFQSLWDAGLRPHDGSGGKAEVDALKKHIAFAEEMARRKR